MATKKKVVKLKVDTVKAAAKREELKAIHKKKTAGTGNAALDRANAVAKKGAAKVTKVTKAIKKAATGGAEVVKREKPGKPQFFGRPRAVKQVDPEKVKQERNAQHAMMMRVPWYAKHRAESIELWVARRAAINAKDKAEVDKINRKLDKINKERDKARAEWKAAGSKIPDAAPAKPEPKKKAAKKAAKKKKEKIAPVEQPQAVGDQVEQAGDGAGTEDVQVGDHGGNDVPPAPPISVE